MSPDPDPSVSAVGRRLAEARERAGERIPILPPRQLLYPAGPPPLQAKPPPFPTKILKQNAAEALERERADGLLDEEELQRFKNLIVFAKTMVESRYSGRHKSPDLGGGGEFAEYKGYFPGLPVPAIDWRVYGRSRKLVIRRYRQETDMDVHLLVDASGSMAYCGKGREVKGLRAARIAAGLAFLMLRQGDKVSVTLYAERVLDHVPAGGTRRHLNLALRALVKPAHAAAGRTNLPAALGECHRLLRRRGRLVVISDFLGSDPAAVLDALGPFTHRGFEILLLQLSDPDERTLPDTALARFVDMETGENVEVEPAEIRAAYEQRMLERQEAFARECSRHRIDFSPLDMASPYREAIEAYLGFRRASA